MPRFMRIAFFLASSVLSLAATAQAATITVPAGGDFQAALNSANGGDTIVLQAGATYPTASGFTLPNKGSGTQMITIQSSALGSLPAAGYRVHPSDAGQMPKLVLTAVNGSPVMGTAEAAHHYQFMGIEFALAPGVWTSEMVRLGTGDETTLAQLPHDILIDRCYIHGDPVARPGTKRGVRFDGIALTISNSYISEIHVIGQDAQALACLNGAGPVTIINNYLEASTENVLFGGADPKIPNLIPSDIVVRNNYLYKPRSWQIGDPSYAGNPWQVKNIFELKNAQRVTVDGNIFENNWKDAQVGYAIVFTPRNQDGTAPWVAVKDVTFTHNIVRHTPSGYSLLSADNLPPSSQPLTHITIRDNITEDVNPTQFGGSGVGFLFTYAVKTGQNYVIEHNTLLHNGAGNSFGTIGDAGTVVNQFKFNNNIVTYGDFGFKGGGVGEGTNALDTYVTNYQMTKNAIIGPDRTAAYPAGNLFPADVASVKFANFAGGDYHLLASSPYKNAGTDGKDLGADVDAVLAATCGTLAGIPQSACSSVPPAPVILPAPILNLPEFLPVNAKVSVSESPQPYQVATYTWSIAPVSGAATRGWPAGAISRASSANFTTQSRTADLGTQGLVPGSYRISVTATATNGQVSAPAQARVTLVSADLSSVRVFPNPWRADRHAAGHPTITFDQLTVNTTIKIFTLSGHWMKTLPVSSTQVDWDLTNDSGDKVASGLYIYLLSSDSGLKKTGTLAIIK